MAEFRRITTLEVDDVTVVRFTEHKILEAAHIQELGEELLSLVDIQDKKKLVLDFAKVEFLSSAALNKLAILQKRLVGVNGGLVLCGLYPEIREAFAITRFSQLLWIVDGVDAALRTLSIATGGDFQEVECAVADCGGIVRTPLFSTKYRTSSLACAKCGAQTRLLPEGATLSGVTTATVLYLTLPTYEREYVSIDFSPLWSGVRRLMLVGRLDLFAAEVLEKAYRTVPPPRRVMVDLSRTIEISDKGAAVICEVCSRRDGDNRATILIDGQRRREVTAFLGCELVRETVSAATEALGVIPDQARRPLTVTVRCPASVASSPRVP